MIDFNVFSKRAKTVKTIFLLVLIGYSALILLSLGFALWEISPLSDSSTYSVSFTFDQYGNRLSTVIENDHFSPIIQLPKKLMHPTNNFKGTTNQAVVGIILIGTLIRLPLLYVFWLAYQVFKNLSENRTPFSSNLFDRIKQMGKVLILYGLFGNLLFSLLLSIFTTGALYLNNPISFQIILLGLVLYVVSEVMAYGLVLQTEVDETL